MDPDRVPTLKASLNPAPITHKQSNRDRNRMLRCLKECRLGDLDGNWLSKMLGVGQEARRNAKRHLGHGQSEAGKKEE